MMRVCLILPVFNYAGAIDVTLAKLRNWQMASTEIQVDIVFSDDGSSDATRDKLNHFINQQSSGWYVVTHPHNTGKGGATRRGLKKARELNPDAIIFSDCDLHYGLKIIADRLLPALEAADIVVVDRSWQPDRIQASVVRKLASAIFNRSVAILTGVGFRDTQAGLKAFRAPSCWPVFELLTLDGFTFDVEILSIALYYRLRVKQIPIIINKASSTSRVSMVRAPLRMIFDLIKINVNWKTGRYAHPELEKTIEAQVYRITD